MLKKVFYLMVLCTSGVLAMHLLPLFLNAPLMVLARFAVPDATSGPERADSALSCRPCTPGLPLLGAIVFHPKISKSAARKLLTSYGRLI